MSSMIDTLRERMEQNFEDFKADILTLSKENIFELAPHIAAASEVLFYFTTHDWLDEEEAAYLLDFMEPLKVVADAWEEHMSDGDCDFRTVLESVLNDDENEENYMTTALERELREKYGSSVSIKAAALCELIEMGSRLGQQHSCRGLGADACPKG